MMIIALVAFGIGVVCSFGGVDDVSTWVLDFADGVPWSAVHQPAPLPPPMQDYVFRPLSIVLMKSTLYLGEGSLQVSEWLIGLKVSVFALVFGLGCLLWAAQWVSVSMATGIAVFCMLCEPALFSAYNYSEFDGFASGLMLLSSWELSRSNTRWWLFGLLAFCIVFLKESACFIWLCFLLPQLWSLWLSEGWTRRLQWSFGMVTIVLSLWLCGSSDIIGGKLQSSAGGLSLTERLPVLGFTTWQFVALWTETGLVMILLSRLPWRIWLFLVWLGCAVWFPMIEINHYETRYFSRPIYVSVLTVMMVFCWVYHGVVSWRETSKERQVSRELSQRGLLLLGLFGFVILTSSNLREDMASRLFLSLLPGMWVWSYQTYQASRSQERSAQWMMGALVVLMVWSVGTGAWNWSQRIWFEQAKHTDWTKQLVYQTAEIEGTESIPVVVTDPSRRYSTRKIASMLPDVSASQINRLHFESLCYFLSLEPGTLPQGLQSCFSPTGYANHDIRRVHLVHRGRRVDLPADELNTLRQDFSWIRGGEGRGAHMPIRLGDGRCTERSLVEDVYAYTYTSPDPLYDFLTEDFTLKQHLESRYYQLPTRLLNLPWYLLTETSMLEVRVFHQSIWVWNG